MIKPEAVGLSLSIRPPYRPSTIAINRKSALAIGVGLLAALGVVMYVVKLFSWGDRAEWAYPAAITLFVLSAVSAAPLVAFASRMARGYWALPTRRVVELFALPSMVLFVLLIPILGSLPPFEQDGVTRANLWFGWGGGAPFLTDQLAVSVMLLAGGALMWFAAVPDLAGPPSRVRAMPAWKRLLFLNWTGTKRQWIVLRTSMRWISAFYLMMYVFVTMILTTDLGQSLLPGWRSGIFPAYHVITSFQGAVALIVITLYLLRRYAPSVGQFIGDEQAASFGKLLLALTLFWFYFFWSDFLLVWYARLPSEVAAVQTNVAVTYIVPFLIAMSGQFLIPFVTLIFNPIRRKLARLTAVSVIVLIGLLFDRIRLFVASMSSENPFSHGLAELPEPYYPNAIDILFMIGVVGIVAAIYLWVLTRIPTPGGWEMREGAMYRREQKYMHAEVLLLGKPD
ncbi:MAG: hypothetical protein OXU21_07595 [Chloroflexota bacterium]|nr:hypothetical protein [Chloroflexota bacterium]